MTRGILIAADAKQEWLLPWWWSNYAQENSLPVAVVDLGMSREARAWCSERCILISTDRNVRFIKHKEELEQSTIQKWEEIYGKTVWQAREAWFQKPSACLCSPFELTLWLDLDCEILGPLDALFAMLPEQAELGLVREPLIRQGDPALMFGEVLYNSGVLLFRRNASFLQRWAEESRLKNGQFWGDQQILSRLIFSENIPVHELPEIYNLQPSSGINLEARIIHWVGSWGKEFIKKHGGLKADLLHLFLSLDFSKS